MNKRARRVLLPILGILLLVALGVLAYCGLPRPAPRPAPPAAAVSASPSPTLRPPTIIVTPLPTASPFIGVGDGKG